MSPERAHNFGVRADLVNIRSRSDKYGGDWVIFWGEYVVTQGELFEVLHFIRRLKALQTSNI